MTVNQLAYTPGGLQGFRPNAQQSAVRDFQNARQQAALQDVLARLAGKTNDLLSFDEVARRLRVAGRAERGIQEIPLDAIVGSVGRYTDFTRTFLPRRDEDEERWAGVRAAFTGAERVGLPPIEVYKIGEVYFVLDGNHRVSVARRAGLTHIEAHVIEVHTKVPLTPDLQPDDLIVKAEYATFLEQTGLGGFCCLVDLSLTAPGQYAILKARIDSYRQQLARQQHREVTYPEAAEGWYHQEYLPTTLAIRERGLLHGLPNRTETDLYLWVTEHRQTLENELGWAIRPEAAITDLAARESSSSQAKASVPGSWRKAKLADRYAERLFADILVPLDGGSGDGVTRWPALEQALVIAQHEGARLCGLHVVSSEARKDNPAARALQTHFDELCQTAQVAGHLVMEVGEVVDKVCERALLTDLVVLNANHPPAAGLPSLGSRLRAIVWKCARPLLAVPHNPTHLRQALLAYDGSPKAREALFVATYLAERWQIRLLVVAVRDGTRVSPTILDYPRRYLDWHEVPAEFIVTTGSIETFLNLIAERQIDLMLMGGYSVSPLTEVMGGGSAVNFMLREAPCPLFICR